jgi:hypothetical protein
MYAVSRRYNFDASEAEELNRKIRGMLVPLLTEIPGFRAYYWLETGGGEGLSLSVFDDEAGARESTRRTEGFVREDLPALGTAEIVEGRVQAHEESAC